MEQSLAEWEYVLDLADERLADERERRSSMSGKDRKMKCIECGAEDNIELPGLMEALAMTYRCAECSERYQAQLRRENDAAIVELQTKYGGDPWKGDEEMLEAYGDKDI